MVLYERNEFKELIHLSTYSPIHFNMYIVELFIKWLNKNKRGTGANPDNHLKEGININQDGEVTNEPLIDEALTCEHNFMPVDSTGLVLACTKCGFVIKHK